tara:strand:+ start:28 stop:471 length:444 start_codon:yes stop_codon:yes gene_type:complete
MKFEIIMEMWKIDSVIDWTEPSRAALNIPKLHNKYLQIFTEDRMRYRKLQIELKELTLLKTQYYSGDLNNPEDLKEHGWEPFPKKLGNKANLDKYVEGDKDISVLVARIGYLEEKLTYLDSVMKQISNMSFHLKIFVDWEKFIAGGN